MPANWPRFSSTQTHLRSLIFHVCFVCPVESTSHNFLHLLTCNVPAPCKLRLCTCTSPTTYMCRRTPLHTGAGCQNRGEAQVHDSSRFRELAGASGRQGLEALRSKMAGVDWIRTIPEEVQGGIGRQRIMICRSAAATNGSASPTWPASTPPHSQ